MRRRNKIIKNFGKVNNMAKITSVPLKRDDY